MNLKKNKVSLRLLTIEDAYISFEWRNNPKIWEFTLNSPTKIIDIEDELNWIQDKIKEKDSYRFAIIYENQYVGNIQLTNIDNQESFYGIFIGDINYWGKGIAKNATQIILHFAFYELALKLVKLRVRVAHKIAYNLYRRIGFEEISREKELIYMQINKENFLKHV